MNFTELALIQQCAFGRCERQRDENSAGRSDEAMIVLKQIPFRHPDNREIFLAPSLRDADCGNIDLIFANVCTDRCAHIPLDTFLQWMSRIELAQHDTDSG
jgi:hypothetical protein